MKHIVYWTLLVVLYIVISLISPGGLIFRLLGVAFIARELSEGLWPDKK